MKLIFAQGNPGPSYANSRHNVGFMSLDYIQKQHNLPEFQHKTKFQALISEHPQEGSGEKIILAKPTTFYNETGQSVRALSDFYRIAPEDVLVIHDELALQFGTVRIRNTGSDAGNKGIRSIIAHLGSDFWRIRIGINNELAEKIDSADFVLSQFTKTEKEKLSSELLPTIEVLYQRFLDNNLEATSQFL